MERLAIADRYRVRAGAEFPSIYNILNTDAKRWWWHKRLRDQGNGKEARKLERQYIRQATAKFREALAYPFAYCTTWSSTNKHGFQYSALGSSSGYDSVSEGNPLCCRILGVLVIDLEPLTEAEVVRNILRNEGYAIAIAHIRSGAIAYGKPLDLEAPDE